MAKPALKEGKCFHSIGEDLSGRLVSYSFHTRLYVLFLITFTKPLPERLGLIRMFKRVEMMRVKDTGWMG